MQLKAEVAEKGTAAGSSRLQAHMLKRLRRAALWGDVFKRMCALHGDSRTALEAEVRSGQILVVHSSCVLLSPFESLSMLCSVCVGLGFGLGLGRAALPLLSSLSTHFAPLSLPLLLPRHLYQPPSTCSSPQAYSSYLHGSLLMEKETDLDAAMKKFQRTK